MLKKFRVSGNVVVSIGYSIEMEGSSEEDAEARVRNELLTSDSYRVLDFDGNHMDFSDDDIYVDEISDK
jgi:hypothetical protein